LERNFFFILIYFFIQFFILFLFSTSCLGPAARPWRSLSIAAEEKLDFFISGGDTVYADGDVKLNFF